ncbi:MAG: PEP-CTERM sorting domain-containing protein [Planctomycetota bacterium]|nr:MAG: PEP-CTERM sorting domain-containing protein [Planctomycetota bacterium]REK26941.1 MAG: PEP-CTERM sorting domain-containing protein [Planctomycetota bacterium]REK44382.1 MAG: PEP-CTERM sorting domain-containing protein [Planctomycetota bacterium]
MKFTATRARFSATCVAILLFATALFATAQSTHAVMVRNISTGYDNPTGTLMSGSEFEPDYEVMGPQRWDPTPVRPFYPVVADDFHLGDPHVTYLDQAGMPGAKWLVLSHDEDEVLVTSRELGLYRYRTTVDLTGYDYSQAYIRDLIVTADNAFDSVVVNGELAHDADPFPGVQQAVVAFPIGDVGLGLFQDGVNTIDFFVHNAAYAGDFASGAFSITAFRASATVEAPVFPTLPSNASFNAVSDVNVLNLDFGTVGIGSSPAPINFSLANLLDAGTTAHVVLDAVTESGDTAELSTDLAPFLGLAAGSSLDYEALFDTGRPGNYNASYELSFSDVLGTAQTLTLNLSGQVQLTDDPDIPDLIYNAATGEVILDPDNSAIIGYSLQNATNSFLPGNHTPILAGVTTALTSQLEEAALAPGSGSIGLVLPTGLTEIELFDLLTVNQVSRSLGSPLVPFDLIVLGGTPVPEPSTVVLAALGLVSLAFFRRRRRRSI